MLARDCLKSFQRITDHQLRQINRGLRLTHQCPTRSSGESRRQEIVPVPLARLQRHKHFPGLQMARINPEPGGHHRRLHRPVSGGPSGKLGWGKLRHDEKRLK
jgi:hypothetical protein